MSVSALEVEALDACLRAAGRTPPGAGTRLVRRYYRRASRIIDNPWLLATGADFLYPRTLGRRPPGSALLGWYLVRVLEASAHDPRVLRRFLEVLHFIRSPLALFDPRIVLGALRAPTPVAAPRPTVAAT